MSEWIGEGEPVFIYSVSLERNEYLAIDEGILGDEGADEETKIKRRRSKKIWEERVKTEV